MANNCKYTKQQKQFSTNSGETWSNVIPFEYRKGSFIEADSPDCQDEIKITRFVTIPDAFLCNGKDKYEKQVGQYSLDNGATWQYYYPSIFQLGNLVEANADICNNKWEGYYSGDTANICSNGYTYVAGRGCVSNSGVSYNTCVVKMCYNSICRCILNDPVKYVRCSSTTSTTLTRDDVNYSPYTLYEGHIGDCVTSIGNSAFSGCSSLTSVTIPNSVTSIRDRAFYRCSSLTSINIPNGVTSIGIGAFYNCSSLTSINIPNGVTNIDVQAFTYCSSLTSINIPNGVTSIGDQAFYGCRGLTSVTIGSSVTSIGQHAFNSCSSGLTSVTCLAETPPTLGAVAFDNTNNCPIYVPCESVEAYKSAYRWSDYASRIVGIPPCGEPPTPTGGTKWIATYTGGTTSSAACGSSSAITENEISKTGLAAVEIGDCVTSIGNYVFYECNSLSSVTISNSVTTIGRDVFYKCTSLISVTIGNGVTSIGQAVFSNCTSLTSITIYATTPPTLGGGAFYNTSANLVIYVPAQSVSAYQSAWSSYASRIQPIPTP